MPGLTSDPYPIGNGNSQFDWLVSVLGLDDSIAISIEYNTDFYTPGLMKQLLAQYQRVLQQVVDDPQLRLGDIQLLGEAEQQLLLAEGGSRDPDRSVDTSTVDAVFAEQCSTFSDRIAVSHGDTVWNYADLDAYSNGIAPWLRSIGAQEQQPVAVCLPTGPEWVGVVLGILKAGGFYVPIDPADPHQRQRWILQDVGARHVITTADCAKGLQVAGVRTVTLEEWQVWRQQGASSAEPWLANVDPDRLCYVMYTSGSSGRPKGVAISHRAVLRLVRNTDYVSLTPSDVLAQASNLTFDAATFEVWGALLNGARLAIIDRDAVLAPSQLERALRDQGVTTLFLTTALFNLCAAERPAMFSILRQLLFGGDQADPNSVRRVLAATPPKRLLNMYGPTENTTFSTGHEIHELAPDAVTVPIGRPVARTQAYVLDRYQQLTPLGVVGELYLGGDGLANGYWGDESLTKKRFVQSPLPDHAGATLYRSGDLVRRTRDGRLEFVGRQDGQVKIRGFRVESGEIETGLKMHPAVNDACVLAMGESGAKQLHAYVTLCSDQSLTLAAAREHLSGRLPGYMLPSSLTVVTSFPLTSRGKIDRRSLPLPSPIETSSARPGTPIEEGILAIFTEVLEVSTTGRGDNFFELGGHSLLATQVLSRIAKTFGVEFSVRVLFEAPTVMKLAERVESALTEENSLAPPLLRRDEPLLARLHCRSLSNGCGSCINWRPTVVPTTFRWRSRFRGRLDEDALQAALDRAGHSAGGIEDTVRCGRGAGPATDRVSRDVAVGAPRSVFTSSRSTTGRGPTTCQLLKNSDRSTWSTVPSFVHRCCT